MKKSILFLFSVNMFFNFSCNEQHSETEKPIPSESPKKIINYLEIGKDIALSTKAVLGTNLLGTVSNKGTEAAMVFCNTNAIALTDSMSMLLNANIKRVSDKNRNPNNKANKEELAYINEVKANLEAKEQAKPKLSSHNDKMIGYYPILTNQACLQCHGKPVTDIEPKILDKIDLLYPNDLAVNYGLNELRGIWVVEMEKQN